MSLTIFFIVLFSAIAFLWGAIVGQRQEQKRSAEWRILAESLKGAVELKEIIIDGAYDLIEQKRKEIDRLINKREKK